MADILRVTAPMINKSQVPNMRPSTDPNIPFQMIDTSTTKVNKLNDHKEMLSQNNTLQLNNDSSSILTGMLNDPGSSVSFLRSIYLLQEVVNMLPIANDTISEEIVKLYQSLLMKPENLLDELLRQDNATTVFQGDLFDTLRQILSDAKVMFLEGQGQGNLSHSSSLSSSLSSSSASLSSAATSNTTGNGMYSTASAFGTATTTGAVAYTLNDLKYDISTFMKALNQTMIRDDILESVANNLKYLADEFGGLKIAVRLEELSDSFHVLSDMVEDNMFNQDAKSYYTNLKEQINGLFPELKNSIIYSPKIAKNISILQYNLSRFGFGDDFLEQSVSNILKYIASPEDQLKFKILVERYILEMKDSNIEGSESNMTSSRVMNALTEIIQKESSGKHLMTHEQIERIVQSLLTSPSNFTPLLHFVLPVDYHGLKSFAEIWVDPNSDGESQSSAENHKLNAHVLMAVDVDFFGRFEIEAKIVEDGINLTVYCPKQVASSFESIKDDLSMIVYQSPYKLAQVSILPLERPRTLMEVFENLPSRRTGINVSI